MVKRRAQRIGKGEVKVRDKGQEWQTKGKLGSGNQGIEIKGKKRVVNLLMGKVKKKVKKIRKIGLK